MNKPKKECGSCEHWIKWKNDGRGLCCLLDLAGHAQNGKNCSSWTGKEYQRIKKGSAADVLRTG